MKKLVILISGNGSNLQALIKQCHHIDGMFIAAVIANNDKAYGLIRAKQAGIEVQIVSSKGISDKNQYDQILKENIDRFAPDLVVLAGFMRILTPEFVHHFNGKMLNIHPSLLPKYPGLNTHQQAIEAGDKEHGASVHFVTKEVDGGPIILQARVPIFENDDVNSLMARVQQEEHRIYPIAVKWFFQGRLKQQGNQVILDDKIIPIPVSR